MWRTLPLLAALAGSLPTAAQSGIIGPMPGHTDLLESTIWLQCQGPCRVKLDYWKAGRPDSLLSTPELTSDPASAHVLKFRMDQVVPGTTYRYRVVKDGEVVDLEDGLSFTTQALWKYRTDPPPFTLALGSCAYVNEAAHDRPVKPYGGDYGIFNAIADDRPDLMLWLGDNIYLRESDWGSRTGYLHRHTHTRSLPELQHLLRSTHHYAIWDDHDFGPNDADGSFIHAPLALEAFELFWANPTTGAPGVPGAITAFSWYDADLFLLDNRTHRVNSDNRTNAPQLLGQAQVDWLVQALKYSDATFKLVAVGGQVLNTAMVFENHANFPEERAELLSRIREEGITGVIFLTGDRHFTELSHLPGEEAPDIWDLTVSPLTSSAYQREEDNQLRVDGTRVEQRNYALLHFEGGKDDRQLRITVHDAAGAFLWDRTITPPAGR